jgi:hypothetical protein
VGGGEGGHGGGDASHGSGPGGHWGTAPSRTVCCLCLTQMYVTAWPELHRFGILCCCLPCHPCSLCASAPSTSSLYDTPLPLLTLPPCHLPQLTAQLSAADRAAAEAQATIRSLQQQLAALQGDASQLRSTLDTLTSERTQFHGELMTAKALAEERRSSAAREREALQAQVTAAGEEVGRLKDALEVERQRVAAAVAAAASASDTLKEENARLKREWHQQRHLGGGVQCLPGGGQCVWLFALAAGRGPGG